MIGLSTVLFKLVPALLMLFGAIQMLQLRSYAWAIAAAILAIVCCSLIGFPAGIWALVVLSLQDVREAFARQPKLPSAPAGIWPWLLGAAGLAAILILLAMSFFGRWPAMYRDGFGKMTHGLHQAVSRASSRNLAGTNLMSNDVATAETQNQGPKNNAKPTVPTAAPMADTHEADNHSNTNAGQALPNTIETNSASTTVAVKTTEPGLEKDSPASTNSMPPTRPVIPQTTQTIDVGDEANFSKALSVEPAGKLTMNVDQGDIRVAGTDQNTVEVQVDREITRADASEAARILKEERLVVKQTGNEISITAHDPPSLHRHSFSGWWGWVSQPHLEVHYEITVPRKFDVQLETSGGGIKVASLQGNVNVKTEGGGLDFNDIEGRVNGHNEGGGIRAVSCKNELLIQTEGGGITIERFAGSYVRATTEGGSISADFAAAPKADCELRTEGGSVTARLPHTAAITLDAHTEGGSVRTDLPVQAEGQFHGSTLKGTINGGGPLLKLATGGGSIAVLKQ
jgi:hypothetical protein